MSSAKVTRQLVLSYTFGALLAAGAIGVRYALDPWLGDTQALSLLFGAVALAVWVGGTGPGIVASVLGYAASDYLFIPPRGVFAVENVSEAVGALTYFISCTAIIGFGAGMRAANRRAQKYSKNLEESKDQLELAERRKDEFLSVLAHELRNPLAPIRSALSLLIPRSPELDRGREIIDRQSRHLQRLVEDLTDVSRIREGRIHLEKAPVQIDSIVSDAVVIAQPLLDSASHSLRVSLPPEPLVVDADATRLSQVFSNLLNNAAHYTPSGGQVSVEVRREGSRIAIVVTDNGMGIPRNMLPRIFEMYRQLDRPLERARGGLGIGLALARRLVELHGGTIEARSAGEGKGSEFIVRLPILEVSLAELNYGPASPAPRVAAVSDPPGVLVVSVRPDVSEALAIQLSPRGLRVHQAPSEADAIRIGARVRPCAVILDFTDDPTRAHWICHKLRQYAWGDRALMVGLFGTDEYSRALAPVGLRLDRLVSDPAEATDLVARHCLTGPGTESPNETAA